MDSTFFDLSLKPCQIHVPIFLKNFTRNLPGRFKDLSERLQFVKNFKRMIDTEAATVAAMDSSTSYAKFLMDYQKSLEEELEVIEKRFIESQRQCNFITLLEDATSKEGTLERRFETFGSEYNEDRSYINPTLDLLNSTASSLLPHDQNPVELQQVENAQCQQQEKKTQLPQFQSERSQQVFYFEGPFVAESVNGGGMVFHATPFEGPAAVQDRGKEPMNPYMEYVELHRRKGDQQHNSGTGCSKFHHNDGQVMSESNKRKWNSIDTSMPLFFGSSEAQRRRLSDPPSMLATVGWPSASPVALASSSKENEAPQESTRKPFLFHFI